MCCCFFLVQEICTKVKKKKKADKNAITAVDLLMPRKNLNLIKKSTDSTAQKD
jgi:hypothetical protein